MVSNTPTIEQVCQSAAKVFLSEAKQWKVRDLHHGCRIRVDEVMEGRKLFGGSSRITADCRALAVHVIAKHVTAYDSLNKRYRLLSNAQIGVHMGGVSQGVVWKIRRRACSLLDRYEYQCMYYSILHELVSQGFDLLALPKNLTTKRA